VAEAARAHEASDFDLVLVGYSSSSAEAFWLLCMRRRAPSNSVI
jgi:hypothetical protein